MPAQARRVFRLSLTTALALAAAYALALPIPYLVPVLAFVLTAQPGPPMGPRGLLGLSLVVVVTLGVGLVLTPMLVNYPAAAVLAVALGLYFSMTVSIAMGKAMAGTLMAVGLTLIPAAGLVNFTLAVGVIQALVLGLVLAIVCQWLVYPFFPEEHAVQAPAAPARTDVDEPRWMALRAALIVLPPFFLALTNPSLYMATIIKSIMLGQQGSVVRARDAGRELLGSTFLGGCLAVVFWFALRLGPSLWMFFLWTLLTGVYVSTRLYGVVASRFPPSFWQNVLVTMLILLGPAVQDSASGKDVYQAFFIRMSLFVALTLYAWGAVFVLERWQTRRAGRIESTPRAMGSS